MSSNGPVCKNEFSTVPGGNPPAPGSFPLRILMNFLWLLFGGVAFAVVTVIQGALLCCTVIGIPFGLQVFKLADLYISPFGAEISRKKNADGCLNLAMNVIWIVLFGFWSAVGNFILGLIFCCTIIGIPFGLQYFKMGALAFTPFGLEVKRDDSILIPLVIALIVLILEISAAVPLCNFQQGQTIR